jgi:hypothetical protein
MLKLSLTTAHALFEAWVKTRKDLAMKEIIGFVKSRKLLRIFELNWLV